MKNLKTYNLDKIELLNHHEGMYKKVDREDYWKRKRYTHGRQYYKVVRRIVYGSVGKPISKIQSKVKEVLPSDWPTNKTDMTTDHVDFQVIDGLYYEISRYRHPEPLTRKEFMQLEVSRGYHRRGVLYLDEDQILRRASVEKPRTPKEVKIQHRKNHGEWVDRSNKSNREQIILESQMKQLFVTLVNHPQALLNLSTANQKIRDKEYARGFRTPYNGTDLSTRRWMKSMHEREDKAIQNLKDRRDYAINTALAGDNSALYYLFL